MPSEFTDRKLARTHTPTSTHPPPKITDALPCPRCDSTSTKFCYYNNYNLSQPRYFCKACRRYWTQGGTLRNVPVGGGTRKNSKRSRSSSSSSSYSSSSATATATTSSSTLTHESVFLPTNPVSMFPGANPETVSASATDAKHNESVPATARRGTFTSMLNMQGQSLLPFSGFQGYGVGSGFEDLDLGFGGSRFNEIHGTGYAAGEGEDAAAGCATWPMVSYGEVGNGGLVDEDCFTWSGLTISTQGKGLK